jgi:hypothetical protein
MHVFARRRGASGILVAAVATMSLVASGTAQAVVTGTTDAVAFATAMSEGLAPAGASFHQAYACTADDPTTVGFDEGLCPTAVSDTPMAGFPRAGATYSILTSGNALLADDPNSEGGAGYAWGVDNTSFGPGVHDGQVVQVTLPPATTSCLAFDFRFFSEEYPEYVQTNYNDAFIAQLDTLSITADPVTQTVTAPGNFAGGVGDTISVDANGPSAMVDAAAMGTTYDGSTALLTARAPVAVGSSHTLYLTIFDQGDGILDSAVFLDNLRFETIDATKCKSLAQDPYEGTAGVSLVPGNQPKLSNDLSKLFVPTSCDLPPGEFSCTVSAVASFVPTAGRIVANARGEGMLAATTLTKVVTATIPPNSTSKLTLKTTKKGIEAIKAAINKPHKLKVKAKKLLQKAKLLRAQGKIAEAKVLEAKAAKLIKRAKKLARKPLGVIKTTFSNAANGASTTFKSTLKRP